MNASRCLPAVLASLLGVLLFSAGGAAEPKTYDYGLDVGKTLASPVMEFANGKHACHAGCASVMISNARSRGVIIWTRDAADSALRLAQSLDAKAVDGKQLLGFLVGFDAGATKLEEKTKDLKQVISGRAHRSGKDSFEARGIDAKTVVLVFFLDRKEIKSVWRFADGELTDEKIAELAQAAETFAVRKE